MKESNLYKEVKSDDTNKIFPLPYYIDTGVGINDDNFDIFFNQEMSNYQSKIDEIKKAKPEFVLDDIIGKVTKHLESFKGQTYKTIEYAYVTSENIDDAILNIESNKKFNRWLFN